MGEKKEESILKLNICKVCGSIIHSKGIIGFEGGNMELCYACNIKRGLIK